MATLYTRTKTPLVTGRRLLTAAPGNLSAPPIVTPPSGLVFDIFTAENGQKLQWPLSNNQFDSITWGLDGEPRDWRLTLNNPLHRFAGIRYYYAWQNILLGAFPVWEPAFRRVWRVYRKGNSGQALRTLVFDAEHNTATIPVGDTVWFFESTDWEGGITPATSMGMGGFGLPLKQKMTVTGGAGTANGWDVNERSTVEVTFGQDLPPIDFATPQVNYHPDWGDGTEPRLWLVHHSFYKDARTKTLRSPYDWHFAILRDEVVANGGHVVLGGLQGIPTWRDYTGLANMSDRTLIFELYAMEQQALSDYFGSSDPRLVCCELENEPVASWTDQGGELGVRNAILNYMYPLSRSAWGPERTLIVKGTGFGATDAMRDLWDIDNQTVWNNQNNILCCHNYYLQAKRADGSQIWWGSRADCDEMVGWLADKVNSHHFKGGGWTEAGADKWYFGNPYETPVAEQEQGKMVGRFHTAAHARGLFVALWDLTGDGSAMSWFYRDIPGAEGHIVQAINPNGRPYAGRAGRTV